MNKLILITYSLLLSSVSLAQISSANKSSELSYFSPKEYTIGGITVSGTEFLDQDVLITIAKISKGDRIIVPGETTSNVIKHLWSQGLFDDVQLNISQIKNDTIYFDIAVKELPRVSDIQFVGIKKGDIKDLKEKLDQHKGKIINNNLLNTINVVTKKFFNEKGFLDASVKILIPKDTIQANRVNIIVNIDKKKKIRVNKVLFLGNGSFTTTKLRKYLKKTKGPFFGLFFPSKYLKDKYEEDKVNLIDKLHDQGYRDAEIIKDSVYRAKQGRVNIAITIHEGKKYYFGNINWVGNAKYPAHILSQILNVKKGDVFSDEKLSKYLHSSQQGDDVSSLYLNDGYLTFNVEPVQTKIYNDTIDLEMRVYEGPQYTISKVTVKGNEMTNDKVIMREVRTKPGQKFSKELVVRTIREISQLGIFDDQKTDVKPKPNPADGTVDIEYTVAEKPSDQVELSGGYGAGRVIGTLGLTFNNFSIQNIFNKHAYRPLPKGDGQKLSLRGQTNGSYYQSFSASFSEPWFGGKKPIYFGVSLYTSLQSSGNIYTSNIDNTSYIKLNGGSISLGRRIRWPDDYFQVNNALNIQHIELKNYNNVYLFGNGTSFNISFLQEISRNSVDAPIYPTSGSQIRLSVQATPPYSLFNGLNYKTATDAQRYQWTEYHKWKFDAQWFYRIVGKLVLKTQTQFGVLGQYNKDVGDSPFERFLLGGDGMQLNGGLQSAEIIGLRGYVNGSVIPDGANRSLAQSGSPVYNKYTMELRYPIVNNQQATLFLRTFFEAGNTWSKITDFSPFNVRRSIGVGARIFLPIFGLIGLDYGYGFDAIPGYPDANKGQFHFSIAQQLGGFNN